MESGIGFSTLCLLLCLGPGRRMPDPPGGDRGAAGLGEGGGDAPPGARGGRRCGARRRCVCVWGDARKVAVWAGGITALRGSVAGFGVDPALQIDVLSELKLGGSAEGVRQVPGLHNGSKAFLFPGTSPCLCPAAPSPPGPAPRRPPRTRGSPVPYGRGFARFRSTRGPFPALPARFSSVLLLPTPPPLYFFLSPPLFFSFPFTGRRLIKVQQERGWQMAYFVSRGVR